VSAPDLRLEVRDAVRVNGSWRVRWRVIGVPGERVRLVAVRAPHSRFRAEPADLNLVVNENTVVEQTLRVAAAPGEEIENAFVIFVAVVDRETWRVLFRVRVPIAEDGTPAPVVESMSAHPVGFTEV
jgi:hypothetical protein